VTGIKRDCSCPIARHQHGTLGAYRLDGCRCLLCRCAHARATAVYRNGGSWREGALVPLAGTRRRLQALAVVGHGRTELAARLGVHTRTITFLRSNQQLVRAETAAAVTALCAELWDKPRTDATGRKATAEAVARGWLPLAAWGDDIDDPAAVPLLDAEPDGMLDEIAVERFMHGTLHAEPNANATPELLEAVRRLTHRGLTDREIGDRVGLSADAVLKLRTRHGVPSGVRGAA